MKFELRSISYMASLSEETNCYSAKLFLDGKHIADVSNRGHGGCDEQHAVGGFDLDALNREIKATYPKSKGYGMEFDQDIESICGDLMTEWLVVRDIKKIFSKGIAFVIPGKSDGILSMKYKVKMTPDLRAKVDASCKAKYPTAIILNDLPDAEIYRLALIADGVS